MLAIIVFFSIFPLLYFFFFFFFFSISKELRAGLAPTLGDTAFEIAVRQKCLYERYSI